jgi:hypothetical protein
MYKQVIDTKKWGTETSGSFYPTSGEAGVAADGYVGRVKAGQTWAQIHDGVGTFLDDTGTATIASIYEYNSPTTMYYIFRGIVSFDTRLIPAGAKINSATVQLYVASKANTAPGSPTYAIFTAAPANPGKIVATDYQNIGSSPISNIISYASISTGAYNTWTITEAGLTSIKAAGITSLGVREAAYDATNTPMPYSLFGNTNINWFQIEKGAAYKATLTVFWQPKL